LLVAAAVLLWLEARTHTAAPGFAALPILVLSGCFLVRPILRVFSPILARGLSMVGGGLGRLAGADIGRSTTRAAAIVRLFAIGIGIVVWLSTVGRSFEETLTRLMHSLRRADLIVASAYDLGSDMAPLSEDLLDELRSVPGVEAVSAERAIFGTAFGVSAFDRAHFGNARFASWRFEGPTLPDALARVASGEAILVTPGYAAHHGVAVGDEITFDTPSGPLERPVAGVTSGSHYSSKGDIIVVRELYRVAWKDHAVNRAHLLVDARVGAEAVRVAILRKLGAEHRLRIMSAAELTEYYAGMVRQSAVLLQAISLLALLVVSLGIADAMLADVLERTRELGIMRAIGASPRTVGAMVLLEAITLSVIGSGAAISLGLGLAWGLLRYSMMSVVGFSQDLTFDARTCGLAVGLSLLAALVGSAVPAWRARHIAPAAALRRE
jgi:putative ABC transport system permease protein